MMRSLGGGEESGFEGFAQGLWPRHCHKLREALISCLVGLRFQETVLVTFVIQIP